MIEGSRSNVVERERGEIVFMLDVAVARQSGQDERADVLISGTSKVETIKNTRYSTKSNSLYVFFLTR